MNINCNELFWQPNNICGIFASWVELTLGTKYKEAIILVIEADNQVTFYIPH